MTNKNNVTPITKGHKRSGNSPAPPAGEKSRLASESENHWERGEIGAVEQGVIDECAHFAQAVARPAMVEQARSLARILDDPRRVPLWATTSRQLTAILNDLRTSAKRKTRGRLAQVQRMTNSDKAIGE
jgi:hypothetical protein